MSDKDVSDLVATTADEILVRRHIPSATYRLQFNHALNFRDAQALVPYLHDLGVSDCYASPIFKARASSEHGYDICDHNQFNPSIGGEKEFDSFAAALEAQGMGLILDWVPNHMGIGDTENVWWMDVLENGISSPYASYFDIDWQPVTPELANKVLLPILEDQYGKALENGKLKLCYEDGEFFISHYDTRLPVAIQTYAGILAYQVEALAEFLGEDNRHLQELRAIIGILNQWPGTADLTPDMLAEWCRKSQEIKRRLHAVYIASAKVRGAINAALTAFNGTLGVPESFDLLDSLINNQAYRPAFWRIAAEEINYRRFFDINDLAAIRVELNEVFEDIHRLTLRLLTEGKITGLRIDHPDGLRNPPSYLKQLQQSFVVEQVRARLAQATPPAGDVRMSNAVATPVESVSLPRRSEGAGTASSDIENAVADWFNRYEAINEAGTPPCPLYVVAEKILAEDEFLPNSWAVCGTTGYDFLHAVNGLFVDNHNRAAFDKIYSTFVGTNTDFRNLVNSTKKMVMLVSLVAEINALSHKLERLAKTNRRYRDFTLNSLTFALREVIALLPVYRTYIGESVDEVAPRDQMYVKFAVAEAKKRNPRTAEALFSFIQDVLLLRNLRDFAPPDQTKLIDFVMKFQQLTGPVMAKAVEDTAFYVYNRLVSLNEVGGNPDRFGITPAAFHRQNAERRRRWPHSLLATSTHDTKRSEDVRARLNVISELPDEWRTGLNRWRTLNAGKKSMVDGELAPDHNDEYLLYQTLLGAWPMGPMCDEERAEFKQRMVDYMLKATKEAKVHTSWINPNEPYDAAIRDFIDGLLDFEAEGTFLDDFLAFQRRVAYYGQFNSLSQVLLKLTSPGVPDVYQGCELWNFRLVDPDNRRPVEFTHHQALLATLQSQVADAGDDRVPLISDLLENAADGRIKLYVTYLALNFRRDHKKLFQEGAYLPLDVHGYHRDHVCAFARTLAGEIVITVVPRLLVGLTEGLERVPLGPEVWKDTWLVLPKEEDGHRYRNPYTGELLTVTLRNRLAGLHLSDILKSFPLALLEKVLD